MINKLLKSIFSRKDSAAARVLKDLLKASGCFLSVKDNYGGIVFGGDPGSGKAFTPIVLEGATYGSFYCSAGSDGTVRDILHYMIMSELEKKDLLNETLSRYRELNLLYSSSELLATVLDIREVSRLIIGRIREYFSCSNARIIMDNPESGVLEVIAVLALEETLDWDSAIQLMKTGVPEIVNDVRGDPRFTPSTPVSSLICAPLREHDNVFGLIEITSKTPREYTSEDLKLLVALSLQASFSLSNSLLNKDTRRKAAEMENLYQISNITNQFYDKAELFRKIAEIICGAFECKSVLIDFPAASGAPSAPMDRAKPSEAEQQSYSFTSAAFAAPAVASLEETFNLTVPIRVKNHAIGTICLTVPYSRKPHLSKITKTIQTIANQVGNTYISIENYNENIRNEKVKKEVEIMKLFQKSILLSDFQGFEPLSVHAVTKPAMIIAGDFYDIFRFSPARFGMVIGDVAGKGLSASLFMAVSRTVLKAYAYQVEEPAALLDYSNKVIFDDSRHGMFVTAFYCVIDLENKRVSFANAGHSLQYLYRRSAGEFIPMTLLGIPMGISLNEKYEKASLPLEPGDLVFAMTDGIIEAFNQQNEEFGIARALDTVKDYADYPPLVIVNMLLEKVNEWSAGSLQNDDMTLIIIKIP